MGKTKEKAVGKKGNVIEIISIQTSDNKTTYFKKLEAHTIVNDAPIVAYTLHSNKMEMAHETLKKYFKKNSKINSAYRVFEDELQYAVTLKKDELAARGEIYRYVKSLANQDDVYDHVLVNFISKKHDKSIIKIEKIV